MAAKRKHSLAHWVKQATGFVSKPEDIIAAAVRLYVERGEHPEIDFAGEPIAFANALYLEWRRRPGALPGLFPTPLPIAQQAADWLGAQPGQVVLDPGAGLGNLSWAVVQRVGAPILVELGWEAWLLASALGFEARHADFLDGYRPPAFDAVVANPPFGHVFGHSDAALDFMNRIADLSRAGTPVVAILPRDYLAKERPRRNVEMAARFRILRQADLPHDTFKPLTSILTTMYRLEVAADGPLASTLEPSAKAEAPCVASESHAAAPAPAENRAAPRPARAKNLPADILRVVEVDTGGRAARWERAEIMKVASGRLTCQLADGRRVTLPLYGRDIAWRALAQG